MSQAIGRGFMLTRAVRGGGRARGRASYHNNAPYGNGKWQRRPPPRSPTPTFTHFISIPIANHAGLRERLSEFATALQETRPPITGLDSTVFTDLRKLHLPLGVMSLRLGEDTKLADLVDTDNRYPNFLPRQSNTLASALSLLTSLKPQIASILGEHKLRVPLHTIGPSGPEHSKTHSVWLGAPWEGEEGRRLHEVGALVDRAFKYAGLSFDQGSNFKLRCPIIHAKYRQPKRTSLEPISYAELVESAAFQAISADQPPPSSETSTINGPRPVDFGVWDVNEIQICKLATEGPEGENVSCGGIKI